jgi:hypothetical protein
MESYIAENKILTVQILEDQTTPVGSQMVKVTFEDGKTEIMPKVRFELIKTDEKSDATTVQNKINSRVGAMIYSTMHEYGIKMGEVNGVTDAAVNLTNAGYERARDALFGFEFLDLPLIEINKTLIHATSKNNDGTSPVGSEAHSSN